MKGAERFLSEIPGTCLGALCEPAKHIIKMYIMKYINNMRAFKHSVAPALTVRKENVYDALNRVVPPDSGPLWGGEVCHPFCHTCAHVAFVKYFMRG